MKPTFLHITLSHNINLDFLVDTCIFHCSPLQTLHVSPTAYHTKPYNNSCR